MFARSRLRRLAAILLVAAALPGCGGRKQNSQKQQAGQVPSVVVAEVAQKAIPVYAESVSQLEAFDAVEIRSQVGGILEEIAFKEGSLVHRGDLLFVIDPRPFEVQVRSAEAQ